MEVKRNIQAQVFESITQKSDSMFLPVLIDIYHPSIVWSGVDVEQENGHLRVVNDTRWLKYKGDEREAKSFAPCSFEYKPAKEDGKKKNTASLSISCIDSRMIEIIRSVPEDLRCKIVALYAKVDLNGDGKIKYVFQKINSAEFMMYSCTWDGVVATWSLDPDPSTEYSVPRDVASPFRIPSVIEDK